MNYLQLSEDDLIRWAKPITELETALHDALKQHAAYMQTVNDTIDDLSYQHIIEMEAALKPYKTFFDDVVTAFADGEWPAAEIHDQHLIGLILGALSQANIKETT